jgi:hypothetical protein
MEEKEEELAFKIVLITLNYYLNTFFFHSCGHHPDAASHALGPPTVAENKMKQN